MTVQLRKTSVAVVAGALFAAAFVGVDLGAQKMTTADVAAKFTGTWVLNRELSPNAGPASGGRGRRSGGAPLYEVGFFTEYQRGGGRGGAGGAGFEVSAADKAGQAALAVLQQLAPTMTIEATADSITFKDPRGSRTYATDGKTVQQDVGSGAMMNMKTRWDKNTLKQQFIYGETSITQNWELDDTGDRINFKMQILNMSRQDPPREAKVVYDRQK
jgi:hypothetical protein